MARPRIVALYTDFGHRDVYAGVLRATVNVLAPEAEVLDMVHGVPPGDRHAAAYMLLSAVPYLPRGTVHLCVVDPGVGTERRVVAVRAAGHTFVGPDNGVLAPVVEALGGPAEVRHATNERLWRARPSPTFEGRDVMAPLVGHLVRGIDFAVVGDEAPGLVELPGFAPEVTPSRVTGRVLHTDHFGNLVTSVVPGDLEGGAGQWHARVAGQVVQRWATTYGDAPSGELLLYTGSVGFVEVAVRDGRAAGRLSAGSGTDVVFERRQT
jgi:S-adenosyl-L-methionine hydrolase (adenosine-forming)